MTPSSLRILTTHLQAFTTVHFSPTISQTLQSMGRAFARSILCALAIVCAVSTAAYAEVAAQSDTEAAAAGEASPPSDETNVVVARQRWTLANAPTLELVPQLGLIQPLALRGGNVAADLFGRRWVVAYSHGFALRMEGGTVAGDAYDQELAYRLPFTTGAGVGYRFAPWLDVRLEGKWHRFVVRDDPSRGGTGEEIMRYDTFTVGAGIYGHYRPFRRANGWAGGLNVSTSLRFWPNVATTLNDEEANYVHPRTGVAARHEAARIGIANSPWIVNVSLGYAVELGRRRAGAE